MTNQEHIEGMAKLICRMTKKCDDCWLYDCQAKDFAKILYNAGYRKADEVRKETFTITQNCWRWGDENEKTTKGWRFEYVTS